MTGAYVGGRTVNRRTAHAPVSLFWQCGRVVQAEVRKTSDTGSIPVAASQGWGPILLTPARAPAACERLLLSRSNQRHL